MAGKHYFVWRFGPREARPEIWSDNPNDLSASTRANIDRFLAVHEVPPEISAKIDAGEPMMEVLKQKFPASAY